MDFWILVFFLIDLLPFAFYHPWVIALYVERVCSWVNMIARAECIYSIFPRILTMYFGVYVNFYFFLKKKNIYIYLYLFILFTWLHQILVVSHGIQFPDQELNPGSLHCEQGVLATGTVHFKLCSVLSCWFPDVNSNKEYLKVAFPLQFCWYSYVHVSTLTSVLKAHR